MTLTIGSLCSGYGGLDLGVQQVLDARVAWHCEFAAAPSKILAHHWPDVPNHRDLTTTDWASVEPVDILTGGYPCQPFSHAGKRKGTADERHIWPFIADSVRVLRPRLLLFENVAGHVSLGLDVVLGDLAALGYDARWGCLRAADVGAPHGRERVFIAATDTRRDPRVEDHSNVGSASRDRTAATDTRGQRYGRGQDGGAVGRVDRRGEGEAQQRQRTRPVPVDRDASAAADTRGEAVGLGTGLRTGDQVGVRRGRPDNDRASSPADVSWGVYEPAIRLWERATLRLAPRPTEPGERGGQRLNPRFVEWMMGLPAGHVTDVPGVSRTHQLKALGNGVVPQQAAAAYAALLSVQTAAVAA